MSAVASSLSGVTIRNKPNREISGILFPAAQALPHMPTPPNTVRPKRFTLELPAEFRPHDSDRWWPAKTENISANGALFRTGKRVPAQTPLDMKLQLPSSLTGEGTVQLLCSGYVVRSVEPRLPFQEGQLAATFLHYELADGKAGLSASLRRAQQLALRGEVGKLVHRLNGLLFVILGNAELMLTGAAVDTRVRNSAGQIQQAAEEAANLVRSLATTMKS